MDEIAKMEEPTENVIDVRDYLKVLYKRRWVIIAFFAVTVFTTALYTLTTTPIFQATSRIVIEKENPNLMSIQEVMAVDATDSDYYQTQYKIIESRNVAREVIQRLDLQNSKEFFPDPPDHFFARMKRSVAEGVLSLKNWMTTLTRSGAQPAMETYTELVDDFLDRVEINPIRNSRLVDVSVQAMAPAMATEMANTLVSAYIDQNLETKLTAAKDAVKWLAGRISVERQKVEEAEEKLLKYKQEMEIITDFSSDAEKITAEKLATLNQQVVDAESERVEAETRYLQAIALEKDPDMIDSIPEVLSNDLVKEIKKMEVSLYNQMSELSKKYGKRHPQMVAINSELKDLRNRKAVEARRVVSSLKNQYQLAVAREETLEKALEEQKAETLAMNRKAIQYGVLQREAESTRNMYELLVKRFKETSLTEEMKTGNIRIIDAAETPLLPIKPNKKVNLMLAMVLGLVGGIGSAFLLEYLDNTIKHPDEIKTFLNIPFLGYIPAHHSNGNGNHLKGPDELVMLQFPKSPISEAFRGMRTSLLLSSPDKKTKTILVTSSGPSEGKTFNAVNTAVAMANSGYKVLLMDCDLRRPRIHKVFKMDNQKGLTGVISGVSSIKEALLPSQVVNLHILSSGVIPPNPSELLGSKKMEKLIQHLKFVFDKIIIDTPPLLAVSDAVVLSPLVDDVVLVTRSNETPRQLVRIGVEQLKNVNANIVGAVLNGVKNSHDSYYHQYNYGEYLGHT